jgi:dihydrofolate reductase
MDKKPKVSIFVATSVDGFIAREDGDVSWLESFDSMGDGEDGGFANFFSQIDLMVVGRATFEKVMSFDTWLYGEKPIWVVSRTLSSLPEGFNGNVKIINASPSEILQSAQTQGFQHIYLDGGKLIQSFLKEELADELTITRVPILLGKGIPLFGLLEKELRLELIKVTSWQNGFIGEKYRCLR